MIFRIDEKDSGRIALYPDSGEPVTYGALADQVRAFGDNLPERCLIFCLCRNVPGAVIGYLGALDNGTVPLLLGADMDTELLQSLKQLYQPAYIWMPLEKADSLSFGEQAPVFASMGYGLFPTGNAIYPMYEGLGLLLATSGSTGSPKLVRLSRNNVEANAASIASYLELTEDDRPMTVLPMQYTYGLSIINSHLLSGACILMTPRSVVQQQFWDFLSQQKATSLSGVPSTYEILKKIHFMQREGTGSLTAMTQAGGKLPVSLQQEYAEWAKERGIRFYVMYGQTEATARMSYLPYNKCLDKIGSIGVAIPGGRFELRDVSGGVITEPDTPGELVYYGENVSLGYAQCREDLQNGDERQGRLLTGDLAKRDADGYYYIVGRLKRFVKIFGVRVGLDECEQLLLGEFPQSDFACTGSDDCLHIYATDRDAADRSADWLSGKLKLHRKAFEAYYIEEIPKNDSGKTMYSELK